MLRRCIAILLLLFSLVLALFPVLAGGLLFCRAAGDALGEAIFGGILIGNLCVLATLVLLLVGGLAVAVASPSRSAGDESTVDSGTVRTNDQE